MQAKQSVAAPALAVAVGSHQAMREEMLELAGLGEEVSRTARAILECLDAKVRMAPYTRWF